MKMPIKLKFESLEYCLMKKSNELPLDVQMSVHDFLKLET